MIESNMPRFVLQGFVLQGFVLQGFVLVVTVACNSALVTRDTPSDKQDEETLAGTGSSLTWASVLSISVNMK